MRGKKGSLNIIITGVGGQGNVTLARVFAETIIDDKKNITIGETFGASQRGGSVMSHLRISDNEIFSPVIMKNRADIVIALEPAEAVRVLIEYGNPDAVAIVNKKTVMPAGVLSGELNYPEKETIRNYISDLSGSFYFEDFTEMAVNMGHHLLSTSVIAGFVSGLEIIDNLTFENFSRTVKNYYPEAIALTNLEAFKKGADISR